MFSRRFYSTFLLLLLLMMMIIIIFISVCNLSYWFVVKELWCLVKKKSGQTWSVVYNIVTSSFRIVLIFRIYNNSSYRRILKTVFRSNFNDIVFVLCLSSVSGHLSTRRNIFSRTRQAQTSTNRLKQTISAWDIFFITSNTTAVLSANAFW